MSKIETRPASEDDVAAIQGMIRELAEFEKMSDQVESIDHDLRQALFGENRCAEALVAVAENGQQIGFALFFTTYSTFVGRPGLYLEDLYVKPEKRGQQVGTQLLTALAAIASERGYGRMDWSVLDWNQRAIDFYEKLGADVLKEWRMVRAGRDGIAAMVATDG